MGKRIHIVLPYTTLAILDRVAPKGGRSQFISRAVLHFVEFQGKATLRERLKRESRENAARDVQMAVQWFLLEEETADSASVGTPRRTRNRKTKLA